MSIFDLTGLTDEQRAITQRAIDLVDFDWEQLLPKLRADVGREAIPVDWSDLSRWAQLATESKSEHVHGARQHDSGEESDAHVVTGEFEGRQAALGLAWYSGRISIEQSLVGNPDMAIEVFIAEGAHMVDFFFMTDAQREAIFLAFHPNHDEQAAHGHGHGWFEETGNHDYWSWVGESFMAGFMFAYAPDAPKPLFGQQPWAHQADTAIGAKIREALSPDLPPEPELPFFADSNGEVYHDSHNHRNISKDIWIATAEEAQERGLRPCKVCRPGG